MNLFFLLLLSLFTVTFGGINDENQVVSDTSSYKPTFNDYIVKKILPNNSRSIYIDGKVLNVNEWLSINFKLNEKKEKTVSTTMYVSLKCECAESIYALLDYIHYNLTNCSNDQTNSPDATQKTNHECLDENSAIPVLENVNQSVTLAITTLFEFSDIALNTKLTEPYFLKTLILFNFYVEKLIHVKNQRENNKNEGLKTDDEIQASIVTVKQNNEHEAQTADQTLSELNKMQRIVLQVMNLIEGFVIGNCDPVVLNGSKNIIVNDDTVENVIDKHIEAFNDFLMKLDLLPTNVKYTTSSWFNVDDVLLKKCVNGQIESENLGLTVICGVYLQKSEILYDNDNNTWTTAEKYLKSIEHAYDLELIHVYYSVVFDIFMYIVYEKTIFLIKRKKFDLNFCENVLSELIFLHCPFELVNHFKILTQMIALIKRGFVDDSNISRIVKIFRKKLKTLSHIKLADSKEVSKISLEEFMNNILGVEFKQFWLFFHFLRRDKEKKSPYIYDVSLKLFTEDFDGFSGEKHQFDFKCNMLTNVYRNLFFIESTKNDCLSTQARESDSDNDKTLAGIQNCFLKIRDLNLQFSQILLQYLELWRKSEYLEDDYDLLSIFIAAIIHLQNEYNTSIIISNAIDENRKTVIETTINRKTDKLKRIGFSIMNLLDNYQIRHCEVPKYRNFIYENIYSNDPNPQSAILPLNVPKIDDSMEFHDDNDGLDRILLSSTKLRPTDTDVNEANSIVSIPKHFYDFTQLVNNFMSLTDFTVSIFFNWYGKTKCFHEIQVDMIYNMLDINCLADYQNIYFYWIYATYYTTWMTVVEYVVEKANFEDNAKRIYLYDLFLNGLSTFLQMDFPTVYRRYSKIVNLNLTFYNKLKLYTIEESEKVGLYKKTIIDTVFDLLGVVKIIPVPIEKIKKLFLIQKDEDLNIICKVLLNLVKGTLQTFEKRFIFLEFNHVKKTENKNDKHDDKDDDEDDDDEDEKRSIIWYILEDRGSGVVGRNPKTGH